MTTTNGTRSSSSTSSSTHHQKDSALGLSLASDSRRSTGVSSTPIDSSHPPPLATLSSSSSSLSTLLPALAEEDLEAGQRPDVLDPEVSAAAAAHHNDHLSSAKSSQQQQQQPPRLEGLDALLERLRSGGASAAGGGYQPEAASDRRETDPLDTSTGVEAESPRVFAPFDEVALAGLDKRNQPPAPDAQFPSTLESPKVAAATGPPGGPGSTSPTSSSPSISQTPPSFAFGSGFGFGSVGRGSNSTSSSAWDRRRSSGSTVPSLDGGLSSQQQLEPVEEEQGRQQQQQQQDRLRKQQSQHPPGAQLSRRGSAKMDSSSLGTSPREVPPPPRSGGSRPFALNALSPLKTLSPLDPNAGSGGPGSRSHSRTPSFQGMSSSSSSSSGATLGLGIPSSSPSQTLQPLTFQNLQGLMRSNSRSSAGGRNSMEEPVVTAPNSAVGRGGDDDDDARSSPRASSSLTRSLSRRASLVASMSMMADAGMRSSGGGGGAGSDIQAGGAVSRITLVRAPSRGKSDMHQQQQQQQPQQHASRPEMPRKRSKSSSGLTPFTSIPQSLPTDLETTGSAIESSRSPRGPSTFGSAAADSTFSSGSLGSRTSFLFQTAADRAGGEGGGNIHEYQKPLSPAEVVALAESLKSPQPGSPLVADNNNERADRDHRKSFAADEPVSMVEMSDDILLPYIDRPSEVAELIQQPGNVDFFDIIHPSFPTETSSTGDSWKSTAPESWTWDEFQQYLMLPREECDDFEWIRKIRLAVRARSEAMWEKIGVCLGCDEDLLHAGEGYDVFAPGGALGDDYNGEYLKTPNHQHLGAEFGYFGDEEDPQESAVYIEGLATEPDSEGDAATDHLAASPMPGTNAAMEAIGEDGNHANASASNRAPSIGPTSPKSRSKSFLGLQISTSPSKPRMSHVRRRSSVMSSPLYHPHLERGPGSPLFPSSFSQLSIAPTLPSNNPEFSSSAGSGGITRMSFAAAGAHAAQRPWMGLERKKSGSGWSRASESAITFASEDD